MPFVTPLTSVGTFINKDFYSSLFRVHGLVWPNSFGFEIYSLISTISAKMCLNSGHWTTPPYFRDILADFSELGVYFSKTILKGLYWLLVPFIFPIKKNWPMIWVGRLFKRELITWDWASFRKYSCTKLGPWLKAVLQDSEKKYVTK